MYVTIQASSLKTYTSISDLQFNPETDVIGSTVPVNEFWVNIRTDDTIEVGSGSRISLYDDLDNLWARYWITFAERIDKYTVRVHGESILRMAERHKRPARMFNGVLFSSAISDTITWTGDVIIDNEFLNVDVTGFCPEQTARDRLQWLCLTAGAYIKQYFGDKLEILPLSDEEETLIPLNKTFWKPKVTYSDYVTEIVVKYYSYVERTPSRTESYVEADGHVYVETETSISLRNPAAPPMALENVVTVDGVKLINSRNADDILAHLSTYYFKRTTVDLDAVNNGEFIPGQRVAFYTDEDTMYSGYISSCSFSFGNQARATMKMAAVDERDSAKVVITCLWGSMQVSQRTFSLPVGYDYTIAIPYVDLSFNAHRYVFRPRVKQVTGTVQSGGNTHTVQVDVALDYYNGDLYVRDVDQVGMTDGVVVIT